MDPGLVISLFIIMLCAFSAGLMLGLGVAARQNRQLMLMHAEMMATAFWILSGGEPVTDEEDEKPKPPATVIPFGLKGADDQRETEETDDPV